MGESATKEIIKQLQFPVAVFACLQAGSVFYLAIYFDFIKEKYKMDDEIFDWFDFMLNGFSLFGILPGLLLTWLQPKKAAVLGGLFIVIGQMMTCLMVASEHQKIKDNSYFVLGSICALAGQGSCLVLFSCLQALMNLQTIQASHIISTCLISYYLGADSFIVSIKNGIFPDTTFTSFTFSLAIAAFILTVINGIVITDVEDEGGFFGKAQALTKGIIYKKTNYGHLLILMVYTFILLLADMFGGLSGSTGAGVLMALVLLNLAVPIALVFMLDADRIKSLVGEPTEIEKKLSNKGQDLEFGEALQRIDFWYLSICTMIVVGVSRMYDENAETLGMHNDDQEEMIQQTYSVYEVIGAVSIGTILTMFRSKVRPSLAIVLCVLVGGLGQVPMISPASWTLTDPMKLAVACAAFAEGGMLVSLTSHCHEEYGTAKFGLIFGTILTFGAVGLYAMDEIFFPGIFQWYSTEMPNGAHYFTKYGQWNYFLFSCIAGAYAICLVLAVISHVSISRREAASNEKLVMVKF